MCHREPLSYFVQQLPQPYHQSQLVVSGDQQSCKTSNFINMGKEALTLIQHIKENCLSIFCLKDILKILKEQIAAKSSIQLTLKHKHQCRKCSLQKHPRVASMKKH